MGQVQMYDNVPCLIQQLFQAGEGFSYHYPYDISEGYLVTESHSDNINSSICC